jgi:hypothetical protein
MKYDHDIWNQARKLIFQAAKTASQGALRQLDELVLHTDGVVDSDDLDVPACGIIALADWNCTYKEGDGGRVEPDDQTMPELGKALEALGLELDWSDQFEACNCCKRLIRTQPTHYGWLPHYAAVEGIGNYVCFECLQDRLEEYLTGLEGKDTNAVAVPSVDPGEHGYRKIIGDCEHGWHPGQNDDPASIGRALRLMGITRYLFRVDSVGQFDTSFSVYVHKSQSKRFNRKRFDATLVKPAKDPATVAQEYLADTSRAMAETGGGPGVQVVQPDPNNPAKAVCRVISPLDFVLGKAFEN